MNRFLKALKIAPRDLLWVIVAGSLFAFIAVSLLLFTNGSFRPTFVHRLEREFLHLVSAPFAYIGIMWGLWILDRKTALVDIRGWWMYVHPGLIGLAAIAALEWVGPGWVGPNGSAADRWKSVIDCATWGAAYFATGWALYRLTPLLSEVLGQIQKRRVGKALEKRANNGG